jgi:hypothetical protein
MILDVPELHQANAAAQIRAAAPLRPMLAAI